MVGWNTLSYSNVKQDDNRKMHPSVSNVSRIVLFGRGRAQRTQVIRLVLWPFHFRGVIQIPSEANPAKISPAEHTEHSCHA